MGQILGNIVIADAGRKYRPAWQQMKGVSLLKQSESGRYSNKRALEQVWKAKQASGSNINRYHLASLVAQWLRIHLPMQGTRVRALVWEDPTCRGATRPVSHNY